MFLDSSLKNKTSVMVAIDKQQCKLKKVFHIFLENACCATETEKVQWLKNSFYKIKKLKNNKIEKQLNFQNFEIYAAQCNEYYFG